MFWTSCLVALTCESIFNTKREYTMCCQELVGQELEEQVFSDFAVTLICEELLRLKARIIIYIIGFTFRAHTLFENRENPSIRICWKVLFLYFVTMVKSPFFNHHLGRIKSSTFSKHLEQIQVDVQGFLGGYMFQFQSEAHQKSRFASTRVEPCLLGGYLMLRHTHPGVCLDFLLSNCMFEINIT